MAEPSVADSTALLEPHPRPLPRRAAATGTRCPPDARQLAAHAGLATASSYRPCLFAWTGQRPTSAVLERMRAAARRRDRRSMLLPVGARAQMLLLPAEPEGGAHRDGLEAAASELLEVACGERPEPRLHAVIGPCIGPGEPVATAASQLCRLGRYALARGETGVIWAPGYSFASLLETHGRQPGTFAERQLAGLAGYDREHGTNLQHVLELALDHGNRNVAARAAFMHRNTFRRKLRKALELVDADLDCPEERLALHLALKLRALERP